MIGSFVGGFIAGDSLKFNLFGWMPFVTQAGVSLALAFTIKNYEPFSTWGTEFETLIIAVIIINQIVGPPLFKWAINLVGEAHMKSQSHYGDDVRDAIIFGYEDQSVALAKQLMKANWKVKIISRVSDTKIIDGVQICNINNFSKEDFNTLECEKAHTIISMLSDEDNYIISEIAYEHLGTKNVIVRLNKRENYDKFKELGVNIVEPSSAMVNLLDHFARSPGATSILLGMEDGQDTIDIEITAEEIHGMALRNIRFPSDVIILSVHRKQGALVCHGFTRLRLGDIVTVVGSIESLEKVMIKLSE